MTTDTNEQPIKLVVNYFFGKFQLVSFFDKFWLDVTISKILERQDCGY